MRFLIWHPGATQLIFSIHRNMAYPRTLFFYRRSLSSLSSPDTPGRPESGAKHFAANHSPIIIYICCYTKTDDVDNKEKGSFKWHGPLNRTPLPSSGVSCWLTTFCPGFLFCLELPELEKYCLEWYQYNLMLNKRNHRMLQEIDVKLMKEIIIYYLRNHKLK